MPAVYRRPDPMAPAGLLASWLAGLIALPLGLFVAAGGQGIGAMIGGGGWIGLSVPWDRQAWALVNQPVLNFASLPAATGYWIGSWVAPLAVAVLLIPLSLRLRGLGSQLMMIQSAWAAAVIAVGWQPFLQPGMNQFSRWLHFRDLPVELRWITVALACAVVVPVVLRLIAIGRITRHHLSRTRRLALVVLHLLPVPVAWAVVGSLIRQELVAEACVTAGIPIGLVLLVAWIGYPSPLTHPVSAVGTATIARLTVVLAAVWSCFLISGRPLPDDRAAAFQWGRDGSYHNIRPWMEPVRAPWIEPTRIKPGDS